MASTDGPYAEAKEHLMGYYLVECDGIERATAIAAQIPDARWERVEICVRGRGPGGLARRDGRVDRARRSAEPAGNRAVAVAMVHGPHAGLDVLAELAGDRHLSGHHRCYAVRAHLLEQAGDRAAARVAFEEAIRRATSVPEKRYLQAQATRLAAGNHTDP